MYKKSTFLTLGILLVFSSLMIAQTSKLKEELGKKLFFDKISEPDWMSCATCHAPQVGFFGPIAGKNNRTAIYNGAVPQRFGNRKPPSSAYATFSPIFHYDAGEGLFIGGNFWDGRATGEVLGNPAADQAMGPFLNPVEQNNASKQAVLEQVANSKYADLWEEVWGEPISYAPEKIDGNYERIGLSIAAYEASDEVNPFSSKYDYYLDGLVDLTPQEEDGMVLFNGVAECSACHPSGGTDPLFTDFTFDNLGTPKNPDNPFYDMDEVFINGGPINPLGDAWIDPGLGGFLATQPDWQSLAAENMGKHKVPTLRNVDKRPGRGFIKAYLHNGVFKSLKEVVHFYNTRDVETWPPPEVATNVNTDELGDLGLTENEEDAIVAFMTTLSDGYQINNKFNLTLGEQSAKLKAKLKVVGPNPFNPSTKLNYYLPEDAGVQLEVFNITGEKVATLQNGLMSAGEHQVEFNAKNLASGIYIVSLYTGREIITVKLMLMK
ncbi:MAG: cytochrome c peroxidase [Ignavibacteriaceae bacterium]